VCCRYGTRENLRQGQRFVHQFTGIGDVVLFQMVEPVPRFVDFFVDDGQLCGEFGALAPMARRQIV